MTVHEALQLIVDNQEDKALKWAVNYAKHSLHQSGEDLRIQCLYILENIKYWRGPVAKEVRETIKQFAKDTKSG